MAHRVARAALRLRVQPCSRCSAYRSFSTSTARRKDDSENLAASLRSERSIASQMKHALESAQDLGNIPSDFGFLPDTFVTPAVDQRPPLAMSPRARLSLEYQRFKQHIRDFGQLFVYCKIQRPRLSLHIRQKAPTAAVLYKQMHIAFAQGDKDTIGQICADGLRTKLRAKLRARGREKVIWEFHGYLEKPKVVSSRAAEVSNGLGVRQAVVRVRSRQALIRYRPNGTRYFQTGAEQDVEEYVVIQKQKVHGREGPWMLWGTTDPTTLESWSSS